MVNGVGTSAPEWAEASVLLNLLRAGVAQTRPELARLSGVGRTSVTQRLEQLARAGLVSNGELGPSTGGRAPRHLVFRADRGQVLAAELGATSLAVAVTDLSGVPLERYEEPWDIAFGPEPTLVRLEELFDGLLSKHGAKAEVCAVGVGLPGPVEFATGRSISPPLMPGWDDYPVREQLNTKYGAPVWIDNDVNVMALGELRAGVGRGTQDLLYIKIGTGIGAGIVSGGRLHRGSQGCAGDIGHVAVTEEPRIICRCGNVGCLEALAGGAAIARDAEAAARAKRSSYLERLLASGERIEAAHVTNGARNGDAACVELLTTAARHIGDSLATLVSFFNPSLVVIGGGVTAAGDPFLATIRQRVYQRSLPLATRDLKIQLSTFADEAGLVGAAHMAIDELFSPARLAAWIGVKSPK